MTLKSGTAVRRINKISIHGLRNLLFDSINMNIIKLWYIDNSRFAAKVLAKLKKKLTLFALGKMSIIPKIILYIARSVTKGLSP